jgi:transketolase C-terminal domain/subunit
LAFFLGFVFVQVRANQAAIVDLHAQNQALQKLQAQQQAASNQFIQQFLAEQNFVCKVVAGLAQQYGISPPPTSEVCNVGAPR